MKDNKNLIKENKPNSNNLASGYSFGWFGPIMKPFHLNSLSYGHEYATILTSRVTDEMLKDVDYVRYSISYFQEEIPKLFELRITVIGNDVFCAKANSQKDPKRELDWRRTSSDELEWEPYSIPSSLSEACRNFVKSYGLNFGALDFAYTTDGKYVFFELNPNGQWAWLEILHGTPMTESLIKALGY